MSSWSKLSTLFLAWLCAVCVVLAASAAHVAAQEYNGGGGGGTTTYGGDYFSSCFSDYKYGCCKCYGYWGDSYDCIKKAADDWSKYCKPYFKYTEECYKCLGGCTSDDYGSYDCSSSCSKACEYEPYCKELLTGKYAYCYEYDTCGCSCSDYYDGC